MSSVSVVQHGSNLIHWPTLLFFNFVVEVCSLPNLSPFTYLSLFKLNFIIVLCCFTHFRLKNIQKFFIKDFRFCPYISWKTKQASVTFFPNDIIMSGKGESRRTTAGNKLRGRRGFEVQPKWKSAKDKDAVYREVRKETKHQTTFCLVLCFFTMKDILKLAPAYRDSEMKPESGEWSDAETRIYIQSWKEHVSYRKDATISRK